MVLCKNTLKILLCTCIEVIVYWVRKGFEALSFWLKAYIAEGKA
jgi:hypothetical protein